MNANATSSSSFHQLEAILTQDGVRSQLGHIGSICQEAGICIWCAFRFLGMHSECAYTASSKDVRTLLLQCGFLTSNQEEVAVKWTESCVSCLGVLPQLHQLEFKSRLASHIRPYYYPASHFPHAPPPPPTDTNSGSEETAVRVSAPFTSYKICLSLTFALLVRQAAAFEYLKQMCSNFIGQQHANVFSLSIDLKDVIKMCVIDVLNSMYDNVHYESNASYDININITHDEEESQLYEQFLHLNQPTVFRLKMERVHRNKRLKNNVRHEVAQEATDGDQMEVDEKNEKSETLTSTSADLPTTQQKRRYKVAVATLTKFLAAVSRESYTKANLLPPQAVQLAQLGLSICSESIFVAGRYLKYQRGLSQTPWLVSGQRKSESSVQEEIVEPLKQVLLGESVSFFSSGREDVDVRMLGNGRPFVVEIQNPLWSAPITDALMTEWQHRINTLSEYVEVEQLTHFHGSVVGRIREGEENKRKCYRAVVWLSKPVTEQTIRYVNSLPELELQQQTPIRVLHRRSLLTRPKMVYSVHCERINQHYIVLDLVTQAGTYVKEFVHGDMGRTAPSLGSLLDCDADILQLDVTQVLMDLPTEGVLAAATRSTNPTTNPTTSTSSSSSAAT